MKLKFQKLNKNAALPVRATSGSSGYDLSACLDQPVVIPPGKVRIIPTGLAFSPDNNDSTFLIFPRSGLASKYSITLANSVGVIDSDYRGEISISLINHGKNDFTIENGMRIAQLLVVPIIFPEIQECSVLDQTDRGTGGFGSSGLI